MAIPVINLIDHRTIQPRIKTQAGLVPIAKRYEKIGGVKVATTIWEEDDTPPPPDPTNVKTGFLRTTVIDQVYFDRWAGVLTYPGTLESKADVIANKNLLKSNPNSKIFDYAGPHILSPGDNALFDVDSQPALWNSATTYGAGARVRYQGYSYRSSGGAAAGLAPGGNQVYAGTTTKIWRRSQNIINGTPINSTIPEATDTFQGELNEAAKERIMDAAFWVYVETPNPSAAIQTERAQVASLVKSKILAFAARPGLNFANTARYNNSVDPDAPPIYDMGVMMFCFGEAFDWTLEFWSDAERLTFLTWFDSFQVFSAAMAASYWQQLYTSTRNGNPASYSYNATRVTGTSAFRFRRPDNTTLARAYSIGKTYNNRVGCFQMGWAMAGHFRKMQSLYGPYPAGPDLLDTAATWAYKEQVHFALCADGSDMEQERNENDKPSQGLQYAAIRRGAMAYTALLAAFHGDGGALATYSTSHGHLGSEDSSGVSPKSQLKNALFDASLLRGDLILYGSDNTSHTSDLFYSDFDGQVNLSTMTKIKWEGAQNTFEYMLNIIWNNAEIKKAALRTTIDGYRAYTPAMKGAGGYPWWKGAFGASPCLDLLYLGMEDYKDDLIL